MKYLVHVIIAIFMLLLGYTLGGYHASQGISSSTETIIRTDTIRDTIPEVRDSIVVRWKIVRVPSVDTITNELHDSVYVQLPITQKEYADSNYHAWVSGFEPKLDSLYVFPKTIITTNTKVVNARKPWGVGVQLGVGTYNGKVSPYIGVGVSYNIWNF